MKKTGSTIKLTIRLTAEEDQRLKSAVEQRNCTSASALVRLALWNELGDKERQANDAEARMAAAFDRLGHDLSRVLRGQQALFAVIDTLAKTFLTCVPEPPSGALAHSVARARDRHAQFIKAAGQSIAGNGTSALNEWIGRAD